MIFTGNLSCHTNGTVGSLLTVEEVTMVKFHFLKPLKSPHEIEMPVASSKFAVGDHRISSFFLLFYKFGDFLILHLL